MSRVIRITSALAAGILASAPAALAQVTSSQDSAEARRTARQDSAAAGWRTAPRGRTSDTTAIRADSVYIRQAILGNTVEVRLAEVGKSRADDSEVEDFAERMGSEHDSMNDQWGALARNAGVSVALTTLRSAGASTIERLEDLSGAAFDQAYMADMIQRHEQDLATFQRMATSARSEEVRELANSGVSSIGEHLALARQVGSSVGVSTTAGRTGGAAVPTADTSDTNRRRTAVNRAIRGERDDRDDRDDRNDRGELRAEDRAFLQNVLANHLMHLRLAERAKRETSNEETATLAERIEKDYKEWQERWVDLAKRYDIKAPKNLGRLHGEKVERLERASKRNLDRTYAAIVVENFESVVPYFQKEGQAVRPAAARRLVDEQLPVIRELLVRARRLQKGPGARANASERE